MTQRALDTKKCNRCFLPKTLQEFSLNKCHSYGRAATCKECSKVVSKLWRDTNPGRFAEVSNGWAKRNRGRKNQSAKAWATRNPEQYAAAIAKWNKEHPDNRAANKQRRRALKASNGGSFTAVEWEALKATCKYTCLCCRKQEPDIKLAADHVIPITKGGTSNIDNIQPLCKSCNSSKGTRSTDYRLTHHTVHE